MFNSSGSFLKDYLFRPTRSRQPADGSGFFPPYVGRVMLNILKNRSKGRLTSILIYEPVLPLFLPLLVGQPVDVEILNLPEAWTGPDVL